MDLPIGYWDLLPQSGPPSKPACAGRDTAPGQVATRSWSSSWSGFSAFSPSRSIWPTTTASGSGANMAGSARSLDKLPPTQPKGKPVSPTEVIMEENEKQEIIPAPKIVEGEIVEKTHTWSDLELKWSEVKQTW